MLLKKGAMFGLDARIALAIFGALSVISGASLYSAIQESKITATIAEVENISKSLMQYYMDRGSMPSGSTALYGIDTIRPQVFTTNLLSESTWNGPYFNYGINSAVSWTYFDVPSMGAKMSIVSKSTLQNSLSYWPRACYMHEGDIDCFLYVVITGIPAELGISIDERVDGASVFGEGRVRITQNGNSTKIIDMSQDVNILYEVANLATLH